MAKRTCTIKGCDRHEKARTWCSAHYEQWRKRHGPAATCSVPNCEEKSYAKTWCSIHYGRMLRMDSFTLPPSPNAGNCAEADCDQDAETRGLCRKHYLRMRQRSDTTLTRDPFNLSDLDAAWLAGLFEGEGCISFQGNRSVRLSIQMTDRDVIQRVADLTTQREPMTYNRPDRQKRMWHWSAGWRPDVEELLISMLPWFGSRRRDKALAALQRLHQQEHPMVQTPAGR